MGGFSSISGSETIMFADNASFDGTKRNGAITTNGQLWVGSTVSPHVQVGGITSPNGTITVGYSSPNITIDTPAPHDGMVYANSTLSNLTGDSTVVKIPFDAVLYDTGGDWDPVGTQFGTFVAGNYLGCATVTLTGVDLSHTSAFLYMTINDATTICVQTINPGILISAVPANQVSMSVCTHLPIFTAGFRVQMYLQVSGGAKTVSVRGFDGTYWSTFSLSLLDS